MAEKGKFIRRVKKFVHFLWKERKETAGVFFISVLLPFAHIPLPFVFKRFVDILVHTPQVTNILLAGLWLGVAYIIAKLGGGLKDYFTQKYREKTTIRLKNLFFNHFINIELGYYTRKGSGYFLGRLNEVENLKDLLVDQLGGVINNLTLGVVSFIILIHFSLPCALIFLIYVPIEIWIVLSIRKKIVKKSTATREAQASFVEQAQEYIHNVEKIKLLGVGQKVFERFKKANRAVYQAIVNLTKWRVGFNTLIECGSIPFFISAFVVLGILIVQGERTIGDLIALNMFGTYFLSSFLQLTSILQQAFVSLASFERVFDILEQEPEVKEGARSFDWLLKKNKTFNVTADGLYFKYPGKSNYALKDANFKIGEGERVVIVGPSGAGKTTLFKLIVRMYDPKKGSLLIGKTRLKELTFHCLRRLIVYLPQEPFLLKGSVMENLRLFASNKNDADIKSILNSVGLGGFFESLPKGYETQTHEIGRGLSGGESQALCLARIFLSEPKIVLLDEPTSWQDPFLEKLVIESILKMTENKTVMVIAHKPSTILMGERVLLMDKGKIVDTGSHEQLLSRSSLYSSYFMELKQEAENIKEII